MAGRRRRGGHLVNSNSCDSLRPEAEDVDDASESEPITVKIGLDEVRKLKETVSSFNTVLDTIDELPGPSRLATGTEGKVGK